MHAMIYTNTNFDIVEPKRVQFVTPKPNSPPPPVTPKPARKPTSPPPPPVVNATPVNQNNANRRQSEPAVVVTGAQLEGIHGNRTYVFV